MSDPVPVIAIDGPTASGKGTVAAQVAHRLAFHYLDSGALYRLVALQAMRKGIDLADAGRLADAASTLRPYFVDGRIELDGADASQAIRAEDVSRAASQVAVHLPVRQALIEMQRRARQAPGLVADGRDMGTVVFPDARLKIYLTAAVEARAERRHKQLIEKGFPSNMATLLQELCSRDQRDSERAAAPLKPAKDAYLLDSSQLTIDQVVAQVLDWYASKNAPAEK